MPPSLAVLLYILVSALVLWLTPAEDLSPMATGVAVAGYCLLTWAATRDTSGSRP